MSIKDELFEKRKKENIPAVFRSLTAPIPTIPHVERFRKKVKTKKSKKNKRLRRNKKKQKPKWKYKEYIHSKEWRDRKKRYYKENDKVCVICKTKDRVGLHHVRYDRLGAEHDDDLVALCWPHHGLYHEEHGTKGNMTSETYKFIQEHQEEEEMRKLLEFI